MFLIFQKNMGCCFLVGVKFPCDRKAIHKFKKFPHRQHLQINFEYLKQHVHAFHPKKKIGKIKSGGLFIFVFVYLFFCFLFFVFCQMTDFDMKNPIPSLTPRSDYLETFAEERSGFTFKEQQVLKKEYKWKILHWMLSIGLVQRKQKFQSKNLVLSTDQKKNRNRNGILSTKKNICKLPSECKCMSKCFARLYKKIWEKKIWEKKFNKKTSEKSRQKIHQKKITKKTSEKNRWQKTGE